LAGRDHTALKLKMNTAGKHREDTLTLIRQLARQMPDKQIARLVNRAGKPTGRSNGWTAVRDAHSGITTKLQSTAKARRQRGGNHPGSRRRNHRRYTDDGIAYDPTR
jgi:hypothetical protein